MSGNFYALLFFIDAKTYPPHLSRGAQQSPMNFPLKKALKNFADLKNKDNFALAKANQQTHWRGG